MAPALFVRLRPSGPWRFGPVTGAREETETIGRSDLAFAAVSSAMEDLGYGQEWLSAAASAAQPPVRFSSLFPFLGRTLYCTPPRSVWPPPASARVRWKAAKLIPLTAIQELLRGKPLAEDRWEVDSTSECLIPAGGAPPFRLARRSSAAVDRIAPGQVETHRSACIEFASNAGLWLAVVFADGEAEQLWRPRVEAAFRFLSDAGIGGERSRGWGQSEAPEFHAGTFPQIILPDFEENEASPERWLLSLYSPAEDDQVDWSTGFYELTDRARRGGLHARMVVEGSVLRVSGTLNGRALNLMADGESGPRWRAGFAVAIGLPAPQEPAEAAQ